MGLSTILPEIQPVTIDTMLNNNGPLLNIGLNFIMCKRSLMQISIFCPYFISVSLGISLCVR